MNQNSGMTHVLTKLSAGRRPINGPDGPPRNKNTAMADIVMTFMNSARKKIANRMPVYSVLNPPTSSCSASTRSKGGWFTSAVAAMRKITNATNVRGQYASLKNVSQLVPYWCAKTMSCVESVLAWISTARIASPNAASYESSCADARTEPNSGYFEPDAQPASITP